MTYRLKKTVALVGMMGSGKTAVGTAVARILGVPFKDSDQEIVAAANMSIAEIFARDGEPFFREKESQVLARLMTDEPAILSTGGGAFLQARNRELIGKHGVSVWLKADLELLWNRVKHKTTRPLLHTDDPKRTLTDIYDARDPVYTLADLAVECSADYSIEDMAQKVISTLLKDPTILESQEDGRDS